VAAAFCQKQIFPAQQILENPEVLARHIHFLRKEINPNCHFETEGDQQPV